MESTNDNYQIRANYDASKAANHEWENRDKTKDRANYDASKTANHVREYSSKSKTMHEKKKMLADFEASKIAISEWDVAMRENYNMNEGLAILNIMTCKKNEKRGFGSSNVHSINNRYLKKYLTGRVPDAVDKGFALWEKYYDLEKLSRK